MIFYANPSTEPIRDAISAGRLGCITTPLQGNTVFPSEWDVIADNGCFSAKWEHRAWFDWLIGLPRSIRFAVAPDVFDPTGGPCHQDTLDRWATYGPLIERHGFTPAFVAQVGATPETLPDDASVVFLGGTTDWKLGLREWEGHGGPRIARAAREQGRWVHMGRVNSERRLTTARMIGCHSADGTYLTFGPDVNLPRLLAWLDRADEQPLLWEAAS